MRWIFLLLFVSLPAIAGNDADAVSMLLGRTFDRPGVKLVAHPIVVVGDVAIVDWQQGLHGGRALLKRSNGQWKIISCGGKHLAEKDLLLSNGVPGPQAAALVQQLTAAEAVLDKEQVHLFDSFQGERAH